jgi:hypothetical protein
MKQEPNHSAQEAARYLARIGHRDNRPVPAIGQSGWYPGQATLQRLRPATAERARTASLRRIAAMAAPVRHAAAPNEAKATNPPANPQSALSIPQWIGIALVLAAMGRVAWMLLGRSGIAALAVTIAFFCLARYFKRRTEQ